ncbi:chitinase [Aspergillus foveolatus]|uniref:chitinase n=1 Tax=Aspergillus foveolatus TaxID=210207 RepID=UPI003CCE16B7
MLALTWLTAAAGLLLSAAPAIAGATPDVRIGASPGYRGASLCPERCDVSGADTRNWSTMFYNFGLYDDVDDKGTTDRIQACSSYGLDFMDIPASSVQSAAAQEVKVEYQLGWWKEGFGLASGGIGSLVRQLREYAERGHGAIDRPFTIYGQSGQAMIGLYIGKELLNQGLGESALKLFEDNSDSLEISAPSLAMQLCGPGYDSTHVFGIMATSNGTFAPIKNAIKTWANGTCLSFAESTNFTGTTKFDKPLLQTNTTTNSTIGARRLITRADGKCSTVQVDMGNGCPELAVNYNPGSDFCSNLKPRKHVCCSEGDLPDFALKPNADGSCSIYRVQSESEDIEEFNKNTWGFGGCDPLFAETIIRLSEGTPPFPAEIANAKCGPQVPGTTPPTDGSDIADINPDSCIDTNTGASGTAKEGTYGRISNCGMDVVKGCGSGGIKIAYYEGYCMSRDCLFQDASQIDTSKYTQLHLGFGFLSDTWEVDVGDEFSTYNFGEFKRLTGVKRTLSFGGWDFSTGAATYQIFRNGENDLDGVDSDWEYTGAPDLPDFDPGTEEEGPNYLAFLVVFKNFPISQIAKVVDYIVYMTYDLHGQWDAHNSNSQEDCDNGNCLRSQVNLTETRQSLAMITKSGIPGEKVVVGVTSYGRSFKMADPSCWGPECQYTGDRLNSNAKKGRCMGTAGYPADAEIADIMEDSFRVVKSFIDTSSNRYKSASTKKARTSLYAAWGLGGTSDWASDLQTCYSNLTPTNQMVLVSIHDSVEMTTHFGAHMDCGNLLSESCSRLECEKGPDSATSGPACQLIWNSLATIHEMYKNYHDALWQAFTQVSAALKDMENKFAPIPPEDDQDWLLLLIDMLTLGALGTIAPYFNRLLRNKDWFINKGSTAIEDAKDTAMTLMGQNAFSAHMGQVIAGWDSVTFIVLTNLFDGSPESIKTLTDIISDGKLIPGNATGDPPDGDEEKVKENAADELRTNIVKCITGYIIPALWRQSGSYTFIIDAGHRCGESKDISKWFDEDTQNATDVCVGEYQHYLAYPDGDARECPCVHLTDSGPCQTICRDNTSSAPTGLEYITSGSNYYGITKEGLVTGSVRTWIKHGRENTAKPGDGDPTNDEVITDPTNLDVTAPGYMSIPVCSAERAFQSWKTQSNPNATPHYPCDIPAGKDDCGKSTFVDQTSDASPKIKDCRQILLNIQDDGGTEWRTQVAGKNQREIASHASCHFGVEATKVDGNVNFVDGGQDVIDIINDAIAQFGNKDGLVGAMGEMSCNGNVHDQAVLWRIY